jgi:hypothetical protein
LLLVGKICRLAVRNSFLTFKRWKIMVKYRKTKAKDYFIN